MTHTFAGNPLDRGGDSRTDPAWIAARTTDPEALAIALWDGKPLVEDAPDGGARLAYLQAKMAFEAVGGSENRRLFLGRWKDTPVFAVEFDGPADPAMGALAGLGRFEELRGVALALPGPETGIIATAKSLFAWRLRHRYCSACGQESENADGGWKRVCPACKAEHFPRTDPVTIMLPVKGERCLLGRGVNYPPNRMSAFAGFLEPGESIEEACARELKEEVGLTPVKVTYHSSQPWPWPSTLMIGLSAEVDSEWIVPDGGEIAEARWFTRDEARRMIAEGGFDGINCAPPLAIAHHLVKAWSEGFPA